MPKSEVIDSRALFTGDVFRGAWRYPYYVKNSRVVSGKPLETEIEWIRFPELIGLQKTYAVAHEEGVSLGIYPPFVEKGVRYSVFKYSLSEKVVYISRSLQLLNLDTWKKVKVDGVEVRAGAGGERQPAETGPTRRNRGWLFMRRDGSARDERPPAGRILRLQQWIVTATLMNDTDTPSLWCRPEFHLLSRRGYW